MARYNADWVRSHYNAYAEKEWERWDVGLVDEIKFLVHLHYLEGYIGPSDRILEIGAGAGRFTRELARIARSIVVADISPVQLELNRRKAQEHGFAGAVENWVECDVCDLSACFSDSEFDAVVCYGGPLSYVFDQREQAMRELLRVVKPEGPVLLSVMGLWGTIHQHLPKVLNVEPGLNRRIVASGDLSPDEEVVSKHFCHMYRAQELHDFLESVGTKVEVISASNCLSAVWGEELADIRKDEAKWNHLVEMELEACREPGCRDMGTHAIAVARKRMVDG